MANTIRTFDELKVDLFQAIKRAFIQRGSMPPVKEPSDATYQDSAPVKAGTMPQQLGDVDKKAEEGPEEMVEITERVQEVLYEAETVFPFTLFPDTITLDREKLTITTRTFWRTAEIISVPVGQILSCKVDVGPFFGSLHLVFDFFADNQKTVSFLWRKDAIELQRVIHGYIIAHKRAIDCTHVALEDLKVMLKEIGQGAAE